MSQTKLSTERMENMGEYLVDGYRVNYLFGLNDLCSEYVKSDFIILELGTNSGVSTSLFAKYATKVVSVDINFPPSLKKVLEENKNIEFHQTNFSDFFEKNKLYFDLVYIDGSHNYEDVKTDIINSLKFIKKGGFISGHDYNSATKGVIKAVDEFFEDVGIFEDSSWIKNIKL